MQQFKVYNKYRVRMSKCNSVGSWNSLEHALGQAAILLTLGKDTTDAEIDYVLETLPQVVSKLRDMSPAWDEFERGAVKKG